MSDDKIADAEKREVPCEVYSRVVGYLRPVSTWNVAKRQEFKNRKPYKAPKSQNE